MHGCASQYTDVCITLEKSGISKVPLSEQDILYSMSQAILYCQLAMNGSIAQKKLYVADSIYIPYLSKSHLHTSDCNELCL